MVCPQGTLGSPVRRSPRLAGRRTPVGVSKIDITVHRAGKTVITSCPLPLCENDSACGYIDMNKCFICVCI